MRNAFYLLIFIAATSCGKLGGDRSLGNNLKVVEGDNEDESAIIYCPNENKPCSDGLKLVDHVDDVRSNHEWTVARSIDKDKKESYWIINMAFTSGDKDCRNEDCGDYVKTFVNGPMSREDFDGMRDELDIKIDVQAKK